MFQTEGEGCIVSDMIERGPARECEMVLAFLKAEVGTERWSGNTARAFAGLGQPDLSLEMLIENADLQNESHNTARKQMLANYRGYGCNEFLFRGFPADATWRRVELEPQDLGCLIYCAESNWNTFSHGTRNPGVVAQRIENGELHDDPAPRVRAIQERVRTGDRLPELIVAEGANGKLILIEGHSRATAYVGLDWNENIPVLVASSSTMKQWHFF